MIRSQAFPRFILVYTLVLSGCWDGASFLKQQGQESSADQQQIAASVTSDQDGVLTAALSADAKTTQIVKASASSAIASTVVSFPPGSVAIATNVTIQEGASLATSLTATDTGLDSATHVDAASAAIVVAATAGVDAAKPFTIALSLSGASLTESIPDGKYLAVLFKVQRFDAGGQYFSGVLAPSDYQIVGNQVIITTKYFGVYQVVYLDKPVVNATAVVSSVQAITTKAQEDTTAPPPASAFAVASATLATAATGAQFVQVTFSDDLDPASATDAAVILRDGAGNTIQTMLNSNGKVLEIRADPPLALAAKYHLTLTTALRGQHTAYLAATYDQDFSTADGVMVGPREVGAPVQGDYVSATVIPQGPDRFDLLASSHTGTSLNYVSDLAFSNGTWVVTNFLNGFSDSSGGVTGLAGARDSMGNLYSTYAYPTPPTGMATLLINGAQQNPIMPLNGYISFKSWVVPAPVPLVVNYSFGNEATLQAQRFDGMSFASTFAATNAMYGDFDFSGGTMAGILVSPTLGGQVALLNPVTGWSPVPQEFVSADASHAIQQAAVAANNDGSVLLAWDDADMNITDSDSAFKIQARTYKLNSVTGTWELGPVQTITANAGFAVKEIHLLKDGNGHFMILWLSNKTSDLSHLYLMASRFDGTNWQTPAQVQQTLSANLIADSFHAVMDRFGNTTIAWTEIDSGNVNLFWNRYLYATDTWLNPAAPLVSVSSDASPGFGVLDLKSLPSGRDLLFYMSRTPPGGPLVPHYFSFESPH